MEEPNEDSQSQFNDDLAFHLGLQDLIYNSIRDDWAELASDPKEVAKVIAAVVASRIADDQRAEIRGVPWSSRG